MALAVKGTGTADAQVDRAVVRANGASVFEGTAAWNGSVFEASYTAFRTGRHEVSVTYPNGSSVAHISGSPFAVVAWYAPICGAASSVRGAGLSLATAGARTAFTLLARDATGNALHSVPLPPPSRTNWTRLVPPSVLTGHVLSPTGCGDARAPPGPADGPRLQHHGRA